MDFDPLLVIGLIGGAIWLLKVVFFSGPSPRSPMATRSRTATEQKKRTYRPRQTTSASPKIKFKGTSNYSHKGGSHSTSLLDISGLHDAFTGVALNRALGLFQCTKCKVFYHQGSIDVLAEHNHEKCVSCQSNSIVAVSSRSKTQTRGKDYSPNVVALGNLAGHEGSVITFEGRVCKVIESRRKGDYAAMFEDKSWSKGFKLVFFRGNANAVGGEAYIRTLTGKIVKVRGLLVKNAIFGHQIIASEKTMILDVK
jgi:hypothetical protein